MKQALGASISAETEAFAGRLARAEAQMERGSEAASRAVASEEAPPIPRVVREAFTIPEAEHGQIEELRVQMLKQAMAVSKSEIVRAGLWLLMQADDAKRRATFEQLERVKTGRPKTTG